MNAPQINEDSRLTQACDELQALDELAARRALTDDERDERRYLRKWISVLTGDI